MVLSRNTRPAKHEDPQNTCSLSTFQSRLNGLAAGARQRQPTRGKDGACQPSLQQIRWGAHSCGSWQRGSFLAIPGHRRPHGTRTRRGKKQTWYIQIFFFFLQFSPTASPAASLGVRQSSFLCSLTCSPSFCHQEIWLWSRA